MDLYKSVITHILKLKAVQPLIIAAAIIVAFNYWQKDSIANQQAMQELLRESYKTERICQEELMELRMRIYNLEQKSITN